MDDRKSEKRPSESFMSDGVRGVVERITARRENLARHMAERVLIEVDEYSTADAADLLPAVKANCCDHFDNFMDYVRTDSLPSIKPGSALSTPVFDRVRQGIRLDAYLHAFRIGQSVFWDEILAETGHNPNIALEFAGPSMNYIDAVCTRMTEVYLKASQKMKSEEERANRDLLEALLEGLPLDASQVRSVAALGIGERSLVAVFKDPARRERSSEDSLLRPAVEAALRNSNVNGLIVPRRGVLAVVIGLNEVPAGTVVKTLRSAINDEVRCGISSEVEDSRDLSVAHGHATAALARTRPDRPVVALTEAGAYDYLMLTADPLINRMVDRSLVDAIDPGTPDGAVLAETSRTYLESELSIRTASEKLFIHPNTLRYRLGQLEIKAGIDIKRFQDLIELQIALDLSEFDPSSTGDK